MRPCLRRSIQTWRGKPKCAAASPCRWPISRRPTRNHNSPRLPWPVVTPGQDVTTSTICRLGLLELGDTTGAPSQVAPENVCTTHIVPVRSVVLTGECLGEPSELVELRAAERFRQAPCGGGDLRIDAVQQRVTRPGERRDRAAPVVRIQTPLGESLPHQPID